MSTYTEVKDFPYYPVKQPWVCPACGCGCAPDAQSCQRCMPRGPVAVPYIPNWPNTGDPPPWTTWSCLSGRADATLGMPQN